MLGTSTGSVTALLLLSLNRNSQHSQSKLCLCIHLAQTFIDSSIRQKNLAFARFFYKTFGDSKKCITFAVANQMIASWCNGSTTDFGSACRGSNPREATTSRSGAVVARWAHNPEVSGSIPLSATLATQSGRFFYALYVAFIWSKFGP